MSRKRLWSVLVACAVSGTAAGGDWKYASPQVEDGLHLMVFCDSGSMIRTPEGHLQVWAETLVAEDLVAESKKPDAARDNRVLEKYASDYVPPAVALLHISQDPKHVTVVEEVVNSGAVAYRTRVLYELDCKGRRFAILSIDSPTNKNLHANWPDRFEHIPPDSEIENVWRLACSAKP